MTFSRSRILPIAVMALRVVLAGIFAYAGYVKLRDPWQLFAASIASYELVPMWAAEIAAKTLPWCEVALAAGLVIGWRLLTPAALGSVALLLMFNVLIWRAFLQGKEIDCGCFGVGGNLAPGVHPSYFWDIARDVGLLAVAVFLFLTPRTVLSVDNYVLGEA